MSSNLLPGENRKTLRMEWKRPVDILTPIKCPAQSINVSSAGILLATMPEDRFKLGQEISMSIPHAITKAITIVKGEIVRLHQDGDRLQIAISLNS